MAREKMWLTYKELQMGIVDDHYPSSINYSGSKKCPNVCMIWKDQTGVIY